ncbi:MAG: tryptophan synthase alpha chain [Verrucomicrobiota bacterium]|jgi:tryptophan synthase alpha chain
MQNRIQQCFEALRARNEKAFIAYICAGDPSLAKTVDLALALEKAGTDLLELGVPFSDPLADGLVNQFAAQRALEAGATVQGVLDSVRQIRARSQIPIVLYTYLNPIFQFGFDRFHHEASEAGVDGLLILDLPPEEDLEMETSGLLHIRLIAPTTPPDRIQSICARAAGFVYYVSREGVTGVQTSVASSLGERVALIRECTKLPIAVGFGISSPAQAREVAQFADAIVVGSAIVEKISEAGAASDLSDRIAAFVAPLAAATKAV